jgi:hypothetical protein
VACPATCRNNADCANCPNNRTACINGVCSVQNQCPQFCRSKAVCAN